MKPQKKTSQLAQWAAVTALCFAPVGLVLSVVALVHLRRHPELKGKSLAIGGIVICFIWAVVAAIAVPGNLKMQARGRQSECKDQLTALRAALLDPSTGDVEGPQRQRYAYFTGGLVPGTEENNAAAAKRSDVPLDELAAAVKKAGVAPGRTDSGWIIACAGNADSDETLDVWVLRGPGGDLENVVDDVAD